MNKDQVDRVIRKIKKKKGLSGLFERLRLLAFINQNRIQGNAAERQSINEYGAGSLNLLRAFRSIGQAVTQTEMKKNIITALDEVSLKLGNTRAVCRKYYVHPGLIEL